MDDITRDRKLELLEQPHMLPLLDYRKELLKRKPDRVIPHFDPEDGGVGAELLLLLSHVAGDPGSDRNGSKFISMDNDDETARNLRRITGELGLKRSSFVIWNVVPWQSKQAAKDADDGAGYLRPLVEALPDLRGIAVLSMQPKIMKAAERELRPLGLTLQMTSNSAQRSINQVGDKLTRELRDIALRLNLIPS